MRASFNSQRAKFIDDEFRHLVNGGKDVWIQASYNPLFNLGGTPCNATNITVVEAERVATDLIILLDEQPLPGVRAVESQHRSCRRYAGQQQRRAPSFHDIPMRPSAWGCRCRAGARRTAALAASLSSSHL